MDEKLLYEISTLIGAEEARFIMKRRNDLENKISGIVKNLEDIMEVIKYEKVLLKMIENKKKQNKISDKKGSLELNIIHRARSLFELALQMYPSDFTLSMMFFNFCKQYCHNMAASAVIQNMLRSFPNNVEVWKMAVKWHINLKEIPTAQNILHQGLTIHKTCQDLYQQAIDLEILSVATSSDNNQRSLDTIATERCCSKLKNYIEAIFINIPDYKFYLTILTTLEEHTFTKSVQSYIVDHLRKSCSNQVDVWHKMAQRELKGLHYNVPHEKRSKLEVRFDSCYDTYKLALQKCGKEHTITLWFYYLNTLVDEYEKVKKNSENYEFIRNFLKKSLEEANQQITLNEKLFTLLIELTKEPDTLEEVLKKAVSSLPSSIKLWLLYQKHAFLTDDIKLVNIIVKQADAALQEKALPIWLMAIRYHMLTSNNETIDCIYQSGLSRHREISQQLKPEYINWSYLTYGIEKTRDIYEAIAIREPFCKELHFTMYNIELLEIDVNEEKLEHICLAACQQFGDHDVDVWIHQMQFHGSFKGIEKIDAILKEGLNRLPTFLRPTLQRKFDEMFK